MKAMVVVCLKVKETEINKLPEEQIQEEDMENIDYSWGVGSVLAMLLVVAFLMFLPLGMGAVAPPSLPLVVLVPVLLVAIIIFLSHASNPNH
ncbi:hypothetical protein L1987_43382 [Smallanthus sonchifolius]|uniref:Uncharacterized protein n=1 Tax=Smallanthus sonchifolius TaxID=185202 RepID=A0ACB9GMG7_9ASTR|nr:hypothetical protein L1987_43382 [Smallanthus sonchifolius]